MSSASVGQHDHPTMATTVTAPLEAGVLALDCGAEVQFIGARLLELVSGQLRRRGAVVAVSGGIDSSVSLALAVRAFGKDRVLALSLPERESSSSCRVLARILTGHLGVEL